MQKRVLELTRIHEQVGLPSHARAWADSSPREAINIRELEVKEIPTMGLMIRRRVSQVRVPAVVKGQLFWSGVGEVACSEHAPGRRSRVWAARRWQQVPINLANRYQCQHCHGRAYRPEPRLAAAAPRSLTQTQRTPSLSAGQQKKGRR